MGGGGTFGSHEGRVINGIVVVLSLSNVRLFVTPWTAACQASLSTISWSLLRLMSIELVMPSNYLVLASLLWGEGVGGEVKSMGIEQMAPDRGLGQVLSPSVSVSARIKDEHP